MKVRSGALPEKNNSYYEISLDYPSLIWRGTGFQQKELICSRLVNIHE